MINILEKSKCSGCHACFSACIREYINMASDAEGFWYPKIEKDKCIDCGRCEEVCPIIHTKRVENNPIAYAAYNKNEKIRLDSSSGGVFTLLAEYIINQGGVVFGVCFDDKFEAIHSCVNCIEDLSKLRGSKYTQSKISNAYIQTKLFLETNRKVLFTGTPCQISGLKAYLGKEFNNLYCQDIICHGVPSPKVWQKYVSYREKYAGTSAQKIAFRCKRGGWKRFSISFLFDDNTEYCQTADNDLMMIAFRRNACLRPSCYDCSFKTLHRQSDITLADFWGIENIMPEMDDDKGTSLLIVNSDRGNELFESIKNQIEFRKADLKEAIKYNPSMNYSVVHNPKRKSFFDDLDVLKFDKLVKKHCMDNFIVRGKRKVCRFLTRINHLIFK